MTMRQRKVTRADFVRLAVGAVGGATLARASGGGQGWIGTSQGSEPARGSWEIGAAADTILVNGKVATVDAQDTIVQALAVEGTTILATGTSQAIQALAGPGTRVIDLRGRTVTPGFIDPHNHFQLFGLFQSYYVPFVAPAVKSVADLQRALAAEAAATPPGQWISGYYLIGTQIPTRADLDPSSPANPVWLMHQAGHYGTANSKALQSANITASTPSPTGGIIEKDASGEPTGVLYNHRAMDMLRRYIPFYTDEALRVSILGAQPVFAACGVTSYHDCNIRGDNIRTYQALARERKLYLRGTLYYTLEYPSDLDQALHGIDSYQDEYSRFAGYKFLIDGQAQTAYCHEPHNGKSWDMPTWEPTSFKQTVRTLHETGMQICVHCAGDAAVDLTLDAYEEAMNASPRSDPRHRIEHCVLSRPEAAQRIKDLGVVVSTNPVFVRGSGDTWMSLFGEERATRAIAIRDWLEAGVPVAIGSDAPTTPWYTPQLTLATAMTRLTLSNKVLGPEHCMSFKEALRAHTIMAAYAAHDEATRGSLEPGKLADLIVWSDDPFSATPKKLTEATIDLTMIGGRIGFQEPRLRHRLPRV